MVLAMGISQIGNIERYHPCQERGIVKHHDPLLKKTFPGGKRGIWGGLGPLVGFTDESWILLLLMDD